MNESAKPLLSCFRCCSSCLAVSCAPPSAPPPLAGARIGGPFTLTDQNGRRGQRQRFRRQLSHRLFRLHPLPRRLPGRPGGDRRRRCRRFETERPGSAPRSVQPIFITVDPARDTPAELKTLSSPPSTRASSASPAARREIAEVARRSSSSYAQQGDGPAGRRLCHGATAGWRCSYGPQGEPIAMLPDDQGPEAMATELGAVGAMRPENRFWEKPLASLDRERMGGAVRRLRQMLPAQARG